MTNYHGVDSNTSPQSDSCTDDFYIGEMGMGSVQGDSWVYNSSLNICFGNIGNTGNTDTNAKFLIDRNRQNTYGYWFILGPKFANPDSTQSSYTCSSGRRINGYSSHAVNTLQDAHDWGMQQGTAAVDAWLSYPNIRKKTIFGDVENTDSGWYNSADGNINGINWCEFNNQVIIGFIDGVNERVGASGFVGIYSSPGEWRTITNDQLPLNNYTSHVWVASWPRNNTETNCLPSWTPPKIGGADAEIWQYHGNPDLNEATSLPN
ncbi:hypothetical protein [Bacillus sp. TE8-1]|uniref:hypothetical protein n=1 Tax=Bacillus sp. TE8-1 TaxID=2217829 RepID=UPI0011F01205|nr:hypothetical protein [Bacillus sp. TE8-1]KAA0780923.1 hypothetical protein DN404_00350 [Bacillus sp. TE8-1]